MTRILSLNDDRFILESIQVVLESEGYESLITTGEEEALSILHSQPIDLLTQDMQRLQIDEAEVQRLLAEPFDPYDHRLSQEFARAMRGAEFLRLMTSDDTLRHIPVLMMSGYPRHVAARELRRVGLDIDRDLAGYVQLPWETRQLLDAIEAVFEKHGTSCHSLTPPESKAPQNLTLMETLERQSIVQMLKETGGNKLETAKRLGIRNQALHNKIKAYGIEI